MYTKDIIQKKDEAVRLNKYLSDAGICSRREADALIEKGLITVDGEAAVKGQKVSPGQVVEYNGKVVQKENELIIIAFNKPVGVECTTSSEVQDNIVDQIDFPTRIFPVGRLDKRSSGLILLTNTGELSDKILRGSNYHEKEYVVTVNKKISQQFLECMSAGVEIPLEDGKKKVMTRPCTVKKTGDKTFRIILTQGLNRQIRRMCTALGYSVVELQRIRIMNIRLQDLKPGKYRELTDQEIKQLISNL